MAGSKLIINADGPEHRVALVENDILTELYVERPGERGIAGNVHKARVARVLPGMQAAFVDIGIERAAFLYVADLNPPLKAQELFLENGDNGASGSFGAEPASLPAGPRIEELISESDELTVQVSKEPLGTKGPRVTTHISLPGRHLVYMPTFSHIGISRRIANETERKRLKDLVENLRRSDDQGFIIRTAAEGVSPEKLTADMDFLTKLWKEIVEKSRKVSAPKLLHADLDLILRAVRDLLADEEDRCIVDSLVQYDRIREFVNTYMPRFLNSIELYSGAEPVFDAFGIESEIDRAWERRVWLKSGGYLVVEQTEALTAIDVNTGRFVGKRNLEETITKTNLEACREIADQLRLRNIGGIIIIDFIDMEKESNRQKVWRALQEAVSKDRSRCNLGKMSDLGLVEMTRKRTRESLTRSLTEPCFYCEGQGYLKSTLTVSYEILRQIRREALTSKANHLVVNCHPAVAETLARQELKAVEELERRLGRTVQVRAQQHLHVEQFEIIPQPGSGTVGG